VAKLRASAFEDDEDDEDDDDVEDDVDGKDDEKDDDDNGSFRLRLCWDCGRWCEMLCL
jgi:hypothetical protein